MIYLHACLKVLAIIFVLIALRHTMAKAYSVTQIPGSYKGTRFEALLFSSFVGLATIVSAVYLGLRF